MLLYEFFITSSFYELNLILISRHQIIVNIWLLFKV